MNQTLRFAVVASLLLCVQVSAKATELETASNASSGSRLNIVFIMTDDMGYSDLGCYGSEIQTPIWTDWPAVAFAFLSSTTPVVARPREAV